MKKKLVLFTVFTLLFGVIAWPMTLKASGAKTGESIYVAENEFVPYNFVVTGGTIDFLGEAQKDVIVFGGKINISGPVHGDVIVAGGDVKISGRVDGNVRTAGGNVEISSKIGKNLTVAGGTVVLSNDSEVAWDAMVAGGNLDLRGKINGNLSLASGIATIGGEIGGRVDSYVKDGTMIILPDTKIGGGFQYWSKKEILIPESVKIGGEINHKIIETHKKSAQAIFIYYLMKIVFGIFSLLIIGFIVIKLFVKQTQNVIQEFKQSPWLSFGWGFVSLIIIPIVILLLMVSIAGLPLALIIVLSYGLVLYLSKIIFAIFMGQYIFENYVKKPSENIVENKNEDNKLIQIMMIGVAVFVLIAKIPILGFIFCVITAILVLGAAMRLIMNWINGKTTVNN
jgi:hypothetical protein